MKKMLLALVVCLGLSAVVSAQPVCLSCPVPLNAVVVTTPAMPQSGSPVYIWANISSETPYAAEEELWFYVTGPAEERSPQPANPGWFGPVKLGRLFGLGYPPVWLNVIWLPSPAYYGTFSVYAQTWFKNADGTYRATSAPSATHLFHVSQP